MLYGDGGTINITGGTFKHLWDSNINHGYNYSQRGNTIEIGDYVTVNMSGGTVTKRSYGPGGILVDEYATLNFSGSAYVYTGTAYGTNFIYNIYIKRNARLNKTGGTIEASANGNASYYHE